MSPKSSRRFTCGMQADHCQRKEVRCSTTHTTVSKDVFLSCRFGCSMLLGTRTSSLFPNTRARADGGSLTPSEPSTNIAGSYYKSLLSYVHLAVGGLTSCNACTVSLSSTRCEFGQDWMSHGRHGNGEPHSSRSSDIGAAVTPGTTHVSTPSWWNSQRPLPQRAENMPVGSDHLHVVGCVSPQRAV